MLVWKLRREFENFERDLLPSWSAKLDKDTLFSYQEIENFLNYLSINFDITRKEKYRPKKNIMSEDLIDYFNDNNFTDWTSFGYYQKRICTCNIRCHDIFLQVYLDGEYDVVDNDGRDVRVELDNIPDKIQSIKDIEDVIQWYAVDANMPLL